MGTATFVVLSLLLLISISALTLGTAGQSYATYPGENGRIVFAQGGNIFTIDPDGSDVVQLTTGFSPSWSPDGTKIAFARDGQIFVMNADGSDVTQLTDSSIPKNYPTWSPDGTKIAFDGGSSVYVMDADGSDETLLPINPPSPSTTFPNWSPDGTKLAIINGGLVAVINSDGSGQTFITDCSLCDATFPNWSPDGTKIAFNSGNNTAYVINPDGTGLTKLLDNAQHPAWSPDGTKIAVSRFFDNGINYDDLDWMVYTMNSDGSGVTDLDIHGLVPDWGVQTTMQESVLTVNALSLSGSVLHMWTEVQPSGGALGTGFTPFSAEASSDTLFTVTVHDYRDIVFDHWEDSSNERTRTVELDDDTEITAYYKTGSSIRGFTPLIYTGTEEEPDLTVNAVSLADDHALHMWTRIENMGTGAEGTTYTVTVHDYLDRQFDHWEDGSTERTRTLTIEEATTITAYYNTD